MKREATVCGATYPSLKLSLHISRELSVRHGRDSVDSRFVREGFLGGEPFGGWCKYLVCLVKEDAKLDGGDYSKAAIGWLVVPREAVWRGICTATE